MESDPVPYQALRVLPARSVLVLAPHPDDEVFGCGGAIAAHLLEGVPVQVVVLSDGATYGDAVVRAAESRAAARLLGYGEPQFWGLPDGGVRCSDALIERLLQSIAAAGADLVYAPSPWEYHPDHQQACALAVAALRRAGPPARLAFYEVGAALRPNTLLDITPLVERKEAAMRCFASQLARQDYARHIRALNQYRSYTLAPEVLSAEAYWVVDAHTVDAALWAGALPALPGDPLGGDTGPGAATMALPAPQRARAGVQARVSVLIRTIDRPSLAQALASVIAQTYPHWELVVVNASGHPLRCLPAALGDRVSRLIEPGHPLGRAAAANALLDAATSDYAVFLDDDDQLLPHHLGQLLGPLEAQPQMLACYGDVQAVSCSGSAQTAVVSHVYARDFDRALLQFQNYLPIHAVMFRVAAARGAQACRFNEDLLVFEDWDFWLQLAAVGELRRVPGVVAVYALNDATGSGHAMADAPVRAAMLECLGQRQLQRWHARDVAALIEWQGRQSNEQERVRQQIASQTQQLDRARDLIASLSRSASALQLGVASTQAELQRLRAQDAAQQLEIETLGQLRLEQLEAIAGLNRTAQAHLAAMHDLQREAQAQLQRIEVARARQLALQIEIGNLRQARDAFLARIKVLEQALLALRQEVQGLHRSLEQSRQQLSAQQLELDQLGRVRLEHLQQIDAMRSHVSAQQFELDHLGRVRLEHLQHIDALNASLAAVHRSTSWRLTRPLRLMRRTAQWLRGPAPAQLLRNGARAIGAEIRRHGLVGFARRLPHFLRNGRSYARLLASRPMRGQDALFIEPAPAAQALRLHPDLVDEKTSIDASVSVVIPTYNAGPEFPLLLRKLRGQQGLRQLEIVIVDSGSQDQTVQWARQAGCRVVEISQSEFSHSHSRNLGAHHARCDYLIFMVQDAYPIGSYWANAMLRYLLDHADQGLVAASCSEYSRSDSDMMYDSMIDTHYRFLGCHANDRIGDLQGRDHMALRSRGQLSDVSCLISRALFGKYAYRGDYAEDLDLGIRLIKDGHKVAMLASVKVVHSHNRPAFYYLKRSYVDVIFLVGMFDDFTFPAVESVDGLLAGIVSCASHVSTMLPALGEGQEDLPVEALMRAWISDCRQRAQQLCLAGPCCLGDAKLDRYIDGLRVRLSCAQPDAMAQAEARRFADSFLARLEHFSAYASGVYGTADALLRAGLQDAVRKTYAAAAGSALGFLYMGSLRAVATGQPLADARVGTIDAELRSGV